MDGSPFRIGGGEYRKGLAKTNETSRWNPLTSKEENLIVTLKEENMADPQLIVLPLIFVICGDWTPVTNLELWKTGMRLSLMDLERIRGGLTPPL